MRTRVHFQRRVPEAPTRVQHRCGVFERAQPPQQGIRLQAGPAAVPADVVGAVPGQQHSDVHSVAAAFEPGEETVQTVPGAPAPRPVATPDPLPLFRRQVPPGNVHRNAPGLGECQQRMMAFEVTLALQGPDGALSQCLAFVGNHEPRIDSHGAPEAAAFRARPKRRIEGEAVGCGLGVVNVATGAVQQGRESELSALRVQQLDGHMPPAALQGEFQRLDDSGSIARAETHPVLDHVEVPRTAVMNPHIALRRQETLDLVRGEVFRDRHGEDDRDARLLRAAGTIGDAGK